MQTFFQKLYKQGNEQETKFMYKNKQMICNEKTFFIHLKQ